MEWIQMSKHDFVSKMVALGVKYKPGLFPAGAWQQEGSVLSAYAGGVLVGQYDEATGKGWSLNPTHRKESPHWPSPSVGLYYYQRKEL